MFYIKVFQMFAEILIETRMWTFMFLMGLEEKLSITEIDYIVKRFV